MIRLEKLGKRYPGQEKPAVEELDLDVPAGEIVILVGPSGCGKTTTMKMINRIIEPSSGKIYLEGEDVTKTNPDLLRRRIGYVIQQIGLFPHMTIYDNVALVPRMLKWSDDRIRARVDELLDLVGMDPSMYRSRYPKELSGGQRQRIGVARALSADPPVMLMDEPFGAIDPITRDRLQNEFLRLQREIRKTIVFVTHDIGEAIKMGDRIAILRERSIIAQYDTPEAILGAPADDFVAEFIGSGATLRRLDLVRAADGMVSDGPTGLATDDSARVSQLLAGSAGTPVVLLDGERRPQRWVSPGGQPDGAAGPGEPVTATVSVTNTMADALNEMLRTRAPQVAVVDARGAYVGRVDMPAVVRAANGQYAAAEGDPGNGGGGSVSLTGARSSAGDVPPEGLS